MAKPPTSSRHGSSSNIYGLVRPQMVANHRTKLFGAIPLKRIVLIVLIIGVAIGISLFVKQRSKKPNLNDITVIINDVSNHYALPTNEKPALATVTDSSKVQASFAGKVKDGDKILIYQTNKKAIVYRPTLDRIVDVEPVIVSPTPAAGSSTAIPDINPFQ